MIFRLLLMQIRLILAAMLIVLTLLMRLMMLGGGDVGIVCIACTRRGSKSGPRECHLVFVSSARGEVPKVDLGNATLSWYRLFVSPARREVPKVDLENATFS